MQGPIEDELATGAAPASEASLWPRAGAGAAPGMQAVQALSPQQPQQPQSQPQSQQPQPQSLPLPLPQPREFGGPAGPEPTRYGDWEKQGRCIDF